MTPPRVLISILNWNKADVTLDCLASLRAQQRDGMTADVLVIDNGSSADDLARLRAGAGQVQVRHLERNLGFTGGHNVAIGMAIEQGYDHIWLLNNDSTVAPDTLAKLVTAIEADPRCGAVSPVLYPEEGAAPEHGFGFVHDWGRRSQEWLHDAASAQRIQDTAPERMCLPGTAILLRVAALREVGGLDDRLFAYFDDNDISTRLARAGWHCKLVFDARALHESRPFAKFPPYFFYLMFRNELIFWHTHMPAQHRKRLWLKLVNQSLYQVNRLRLRGNPRQAEAALLGTWDFIAGRDGAPDLARRPPLALRLACGLLALHHNKQLRAAEAGQAAAA